MAKAQRISQFTSFCESGSLRPSTKEAGGGRVYKGITIIRAGLGNRRDMNYYPASALREAVEAGKFEGLRAYADHPTSVDEQIQPERTVRDLVGLYTNARYAESRGGAPARVVADLRILKAHRWLSDVVDELIEVDHADKIGISINGNGRTERRPVKEAGEELEANVVTEFQTLRSADVVTEAGAGGGFQQILESARGASQENTMNRKAIMKALREAADAGETEKVKELTTQLEECDCEAKAADAPRRGKKATKPVAEAKKKDEDDEDAVAEEDEDEVDQDRELDDATREAAGADDDEDADDLEDEGDDLDEADADEDDDEVEEEDDNTRRANGARRAVDRLRRHQEAKGPLAKGAPASGKGSFVKKTPSGKRGNQSGRKYAEANATGSGVNRLELVNDPVVEQLKRQLRKERSRNERLAESLGAHRRADLARKLLKESDIAPDLRPALVARLVRGCPGGDLREAERYMQKEIDFHQRLVESVAGRAAAAYDDFDEVEGAGSRFKESYGGDTGEDDFLALFRESGLPMKAAKK